MADPLIEDIPLGQLSIDITNPRHPHQASQREALHIIAREQGPKLYNLAEDIVDKGLNPSEIILVTPADEHGMYTVLEGNRRIAALKLLGSQDLLKSMGLRANLESRYIDLQQRARRDGAIPTSIRCAVIPREDATHWIQLKHTGENGGVGIVPWDGVASQRFRKESPALQAIDMVRESNYIDDETKKNLHKIAVTTVERVLNTPEARQALGVDVKGGILSIVAPNQDEALARLAILVGDVASKRVRVSHVDTKPLRIEYARRIAATPPPSQGVTGAPGSGTGVAAPQSNQGRTGAMRRVNPHRKTLIPRDFILAIHQTRINQIYHELQKVDVKEFVNCCAVMLRVFVELSVDEYAKRKSISLKKTFPPKGGTTAPRVVDMTLREKISAVADYLATNNLCDKHQLQGIRALISQPGHVLSVESLNGYVHNQNYTPTATDIKANWDSIESFVSALWTP